MRLIQSYTKAKEAALEAKLPAGPLSYTQISTYLICPKSYEWRYIIKPEMIQLFSPSLIFGRILHEALESLGKDIINGSKAMVSRACRVADTSFHDQLKSIPEEIPREIKAIAQQQLNCIKVLIKDWSISELPELNPTGIEEKIYGYVGDVPLIVKIDLINNNSEVIDYKLTKRFKNAKDAKASLQLSLYSMLTELDRVGFTNFRFPNVEQKKKWKSEIASVRVIKNVGDRNWAEDVVGSIANAIRAGVFPPCDPAAWKCSIEQCEFYAGCRGKREQKSNQPSWMSGMLGSW